MPDSPMGQLGGSPQRITHGRHCVCSACAREDWTNSKVAYCGMHGADCPALYQPWGRAGSYYDPAAGALLTCRYHGCREVAVVWLSVVHDRGHPLCEKHAKEIKAYIAAKIDEALNA